MKTRRRESAASNSPRNRRASKNSEFLVVCDVPPPAAGFCHPADLLDISQGTRGGFRVGSLLARRREKKPVRPIADGESSFALSLRVVALRNSRRTVMKFVIASLFLVAGFIALSSVEASAVVCARGVYRAGCVAPGGAVVVGRTVVAPRAVVAPRRRVY
jgi:hypothetical protein